MSRQRLFPPVKEGAFDRCEVCEGAGLVKSKSAIALGVLRKIQSVIAEKNVKSLSAEISNVGSQRTCVHYSLFLES